MSLIKADESHPTLLKIHKRSRTQHIYSSRQAHDGRGSIREGSMIVECAGDAVLGARPFICIVMIMIPSDDSAI